MFSNDTIIMKMNNVVLVALIAVVILLIIGIYMMRKSSESFYMKKYEGFALTSPSMIVPPPMPRLETVPPSYAQNKALADAPREPEVIGSFTSVAVNRMTGPYVPGPGYVGRETYDVSAPIPCDPFSNQTCFTRV
jgi:hypothetical protein